jgi:DNA-binding transcriptional LysR family regulator
LEDRHLRYFEAVATTGSIRRAANTMNVEPSAVSRQVTQLERRLNVKLFERSKRGVLATESGLVLLDYCRKRLAEEGMLLSQLADADGVLRGRVHIIAGEGYTEELLRWIFGEFCRKHSELQIILEQAGAFAAIAAVGNERAHIGITYSTQLEPSVKLVRAYPQPICLIAPPGHPLLDQKQPPSMAEIAAYPIALAHEGFGLGRAVRRAAETAGVRIEPLLTTNSLANLRSFVRLGLGVTLTSARLMADEIAKGTCCARITASQILNDAKVLVFTHRSRQLTRPVEVVLNYILARSDVWQSDAPIAQ